MPNQKSSFKNHHSKIKNNNGSAMVAVLVIMAVALLVITAIMQNSLIDTDMSFNLKKSDEAYNNAVSAIEESKLRLLRDPAFTGATLNFSDGSATININKLSETQRQIFVISRVGNKYICQLSASATYNASGVLLINTIQEITN